MACALVFKVADTEAEFEQIHRLNYRTFVEEIPQHRPNSDERLVDAFHDENEYLVCVFSGTVVGMVALRARRPFSLDRKLADLDRYLPAGRALCEVRLLAVDPAFRTGRVLHGLLRMIGEWFDRNACDLAVISGAVSQQELYQHLGFVPFGPLVGTETAPYQPMYLAKETFWDRYRDRRTNLGSAGPQPAVPANFSNC